jgi:hypothetical protein
MGREYHAGVAARSQKGGLDEVQRYWADYFARGTGGDVQVGRSQGAVEIDVRDCLAIRRLIDSRRETVPYNTDRKVKPAMWSPRWPSR